MAEEHEQHLRIVLGLLLEHKLYAKHKKCAFWLSSVSFLGHVIRDKGLSVDPSKIAEVVECPRPKNVSELRSFLGLASYYRRFVKSFSSIAKPLTKLTQKGQNFLWSDECESSF